jgi:hypothetical protein
MLEPPLDRRLLLLGQQEFSFCHCAVVADQREDPVAACLLVLPLQLDPMRQREPQLLFPNDVPCFPPGRPRRSWRYFSVS